VVVGGSIPLAPTISLDHKALLGGSFSFGS